MANCLGGCGRSISHETAYCSICYPEYEECIRTGRMPPGFTRPPEELDYPTFLEIKSKLNDIRRELMEADVAEDKLSAESHMQSAQAKQAAYDKYIAAHCRRLERRANSKPKSIDQAALKKIPW